MAKNKNIKKTSKKKKKNNKKSLIYSPFMLQPGARGNMINIGKTPTITSSKNITNK